MGQRHDDSPGTDEARRAGRSAGADTRLTLMGGFELAWQGRAVELHARAQQLIAFLALHDRPVQRQRVAGTLWPDHSDARAMANLRTTLWRVNRAGMRSVEVIGERLVLDPAIRVDVRELTDAAHRMFEGREPDDGEWLSSITQAGDLLPGWDEDWVIVEREHVRQLRLHVLELLCERLAAAGRFGLAVEACLAAVASEPLRESAQRALIKVYLAEGNAGDAVHQFRAYRQLMREELGLKPSIQMENLVRELLPR